ncbi:hypothetical protein K443DRAFT_808 [Laccaria amethystina LaAM-08-1]|uniref:Crinkler effector protein N-terminal domain-containing protein n=1 Tax=Laccaria amethystina LaAM-08-1 TaxID=1095629 RepID=A0A0C9Y5A1_9AGAR|nr:hypothetical protein K443DRAFT_808 [Laccaria amethystina LaAM-08-1]
MPTTLQLNCLIEGEDIVFVIPVEPDDHVSKLKGAIQSERAMDSLKDVGPHTLELWKVDIDLDSHDNQYLTNIKLGDLQSQELAPWRSMLAYWPAEDPHLHNHLHIIVKATSALKRKRDDPRQNRRSGISHLKEHLEEPLDPDCKIPLSHADWRTLLTNGLVRSQVCTAEDLELLFKQSEDETAISILDILKTAIKEGPVDPSGTEKSLISFWDANIRNILQRCLDVAGIRDSNQGTETGSLQPNFGLILAHVYVFRGEEKRLIFTGTHPRDELKFKTRDGGKSIEYFSSHLRKTYGLDNIDDGKERVKHLKAIYALLTLKGVPNVDRLKKAEIQHHVHGSYVDLEPRGNDAGPKSFLDVRNAVVCVLEALKVAHADPPVFHRDIRWPNIMQSHKDSSKWFLIDWEDASFAPTKGAPHLSKNEHSPNVYKDNHGADVDIWAVGRLIFTSLLQVPALRDLGQMMTEGHVSNAEQGLREICNLPPF